MDEYTGFAKWGLLWVLIGLGIWVVFIRKREPAALTTSPDESEMSATPSRRRLTEPDHFYKHALDVLNRVFEDVARGVAAGDQPLLFLFLAALVTSAYRVEFRSSLGEEGSEAFQEAMWRASLSQFQTRFPGWEQEDEDALDEGEYLAEELDNALDLWSDYVEARPAREPLAAWRLALRKNFHDEIDETWAGAQARAAELIFDDLEREFPAETL